MSAHADQLFQSYLKDAKQPFCGWDFSYITDTGRMQSELLPWSYGSMVAPLLRRAETMLDMGTGGGEFLSKLRPLPPSVYATEAYQPNVPIAKGRLEPLGVTVVPIQDDDALPFEDGNFDLIINRHESYSPQEVRRILADNAVFLTQQVGGMDCIQINEALGAPFHEYADWNLEAALQQLRENNFRILFGKEHFSVQRFYDIGALFYYLQAIPWQIPDFTIDAYLEKLYSIHQQIETNGYFDVKQHRFVIKAAAN